MSILSYFVNNSLLLISFSNIYKAVRTANGNFSRNSLTLTQEQDSAENEQLFSQTLRNRYPAEQEKLYIPENETNTNVIIDSAQFTSASSIFTTDDDNNQNINTIPNLLLSDNAEFDDGIWIYIIFKH